MVKWSSRFIKRGPWKTNLQTDQFNLYLTLWKTNLQTDRFNLWKTNLQTDRFCPMEDEPTNRSVQSMPPRDVTLLQTRLISSEGLEVSLHTERLDLR